MLPITSCVLRPLFKLDKLLEALLQGANANKAAGDDAKPPPTYQRANPTTAEGIVRYLWEVAYPGGATPSEALEFFSDDIRYEDFNYNEPFVGLEDVSAYIGLLDVFPNFVFIPEKISEGKKGVRSRSHAQTLRRCAAVLARGLCRSASSSRITTPRA